jgi:hypothetical protein
VTWVGAQTLGHVGQGKLLNLLLGKPQDEPERQTLEPRAARRQSARHRARGARENHWTSADRHPNKETSEKTDVLIAHQLHTNPPPVIDESFRRHARATKKSEPDGKSS